MERSSKALATFACAFLFIYILVGLTDPVEIILVLAANIKHSAMLLGFVKDIWVVWAEGGVIGFIYWIFSGFRKTIEFASISNVWDVIVAIFKDNFFDNLVW